MKGIYCSMVLCLFLALVALGLQIAASVTQGWKIIEGEHLIQRAPWVTPSMFKMGENETKHASIQIGVWTMKICVSGRCLDIEDYRPNPNQLVKYFEGTPGELQAMSVFGCILAGVAALCFWPFFHVLDQKMNCYGIYVSILLAMSGFCCLTLGYLMYQTVENIEDLFIDRNEEIKTSFPYCFILLLVGFAATFAGSLISSVTICKLNQHIEHEERLLIERERNMDKDDIFSQNIFSKSRPPKSAISIQNKEQVVYSIHL